MNKIRKGDEVIVLTGRDKGKRGKVLARVDADHLSVEGVNIVKKHKKPNQKTMQAGIISQEALVAASNVMVVCPRCNTPARTGSRILEDGRTVRACGNCGEVIDK